MKLAGLAVAAVIGLAAGQANAVSIDFTKQSGGINWLGGTSNTNFIAGIGNVTVTSVSGGNLNADGVIGTPPCGGVFGLACDRDGVGIGDDEVTYGLVGQGEVLRVTFEDTAVNILDIGFLDLFSPEGGAAETARWDSDGSGADDIGSADGTTSGGNGWIVAVMLDINGVTSIDFFVGPPSNPQSDFALAYMNVAAVPIPAALPLFAGGLGFLGLLGWRRKRKAAA